MNRGSMSITRICDNCPILNNDTEEGSWCNLGFDIDDYTKLVVRKLHVFSYERHTVAKDCKLEKLVLNDGTEILPEFIDAELP